MENAILSYLSELEKKYHVKILYACESGSRSFGTHSESSDYDVRFIFVRKIKEYVQLKQPHDVITFHVENIEFHGWDLLKTMRLLQKSNPSLYEWVFSPIIYINIDDFNSNLKTHIQTQYSLKTIGKHYLNLFKGNLKQISKGHQQTKLILQCVKGLLSIHWILQFTTLPPVSYDILIKGSHYPDDIKNSFWELLKMKRMNIQNESIVQFLISFLTSEMHLLKTQVEILPNTVQNEKTGNELIWSILDIEKF